MWLAVWQVVLVDLGVLTSAVNDWQGTEPIACVQLRVEQTENRDNKPTIIYLTVY